MSTTLSSILMKCLKPSHSKVPDDLLMDSRPSMLDGKTTARDNDNDEAGDNDDNDDDGDDDCDDEGDDEGDDDDDKGCCC